MNTDQSSQMMSRSFGIWPPLHPGATIGGDPMAVVFQNVPPPAIFKSGAGAAAAAAVQPARMMAWNGGGVAAATATELQRQSWAKARRFFPKKKMARFAPYAPRNTTSFIIRAKKSGGIAPLVSPSPVTPAVLTTPKISPMPGGLADMAKEEFGVDGYGSMKGLIRLRPPTRGGSAMEDDGSSESDLEVERRLDHDLSRFEMVYPSFGGGGGDREEADVDRDAHIARLEEENLTMKERMFLMEVEMRDLRRRMQLLETKFQASDDNNNNDSKENKVGDTEGGWRMMTTRAEEAAATSKKKRGLELHCRSDVVVVVVK